MSSVVAGKENEEGEKFRDYYDYSETVRTVPSHRALALFRGRNVGLLSVKLGLGEELDAQIPHPCESMIAGHFGIVNRAHRGQMARRRVPLVLAREGAAAH